MDPRLFRYQPAGSNAAGLLSCSENSLRFTCEFQPGPGPPQGPGDEGYSVDTDYDSVCVVLPAQCSVHQLRLRICMQAQETKCHPDLLAILDPKKYTLLYARGEDWYEAYDDCQVIRTLDIPWSSDDTGRLSAQIVAKPQVMVESEETQKQWQTLAYLIGHDLDKEASDRLGEVTFTRRKLASPRRQELRNRDEELYVTEPWVTSAPMPKDLQDQLNRKLSVNLHYMSMISFSVQVDLSVTPNVLFRVFGRVMADQELEFDTSDRLVLKVSGREEFLFGDLPLHDFCWVRQCLETGEDLHLSVVPVSQLVEKAVNITDLLPLVDDFTGQFSSHEDLRLEGKDLDDIFMISLLDCNRKFRVKLLGFDIPKLPSKYLQSVFVEISILHGNKVLSSVSSTSKAFTDEVLWNEWLEFDVLLRDLPRGTKLGFSVNACTNDSSPVTKDSKPTASSKAPDPQKGKGKVLWFVNLLLIDHRSVLSQGSYTLNMWSHPDQEDEAFTYQADKLSSATNPDIAESMAISFLLDSYSFPVVLPNSFRMPENSCSPTSNPSPTKGSPSSLSPIPACSVSSSPPSLPIKPKPPTPTETPGKPLHGQSPDSVTFRSQSRVLGKNFNSLQNFRDKSVRYASMLPQFLRSVEWMNSSVVDEIHWLLSQWDAGELDLTVALELLSLDFADEAVRRLAVQRLESLSNDEVLKYLLQLVQTLKVEPYHDSYLARYLIQRALRSKRIGHFFFWYIRSEVAGCPYFRQRMAVLLEAYLLGCGQAMLDSFTLQVQAVEALQGVACEIKRLYPERADIPPAAVVQELLRNCDLPNEFLLPLNPRIKCGRILIEKCKVMASKKKPLWLEFVPMPSPTSTTPVGIIFKQGDDLRQDMLIIQTLVVMESIWQEMDLDLNLVPYGCISTGHNIGMIEIVRNAATIATVQRSQGGTSGAFKNDALFVWLKSKCLLQEIHYETVERFVKSCAGYCVATYVLGIGDRHNDNIMITDQGNLFHIDFGHILGNRKHFLGVNRERVPFVLTPDFLYVMGRVKGRNSLYFQRFIDTCTQAYLALRSHSRLLVTLFSLMLVTGIPELSAAEDMRYLREVLQTEVGENQAREHFLQQIGVCEKQGWQVQANWWIHMHLGIH
ncbi:phosphatidylinositol 4,5-bisphosphate 3-kinase catalytic subunit gamma isoform [Genypterus blacodes]|uniref:phosphatidylinositol 4,5-bisphosphate 3-kinase catalytic subunit gamma isoform n=1 Tax=Genypterus blacodes TaxID=154954 RepID=UPI003F770FE6